jgi:acyl carrier protein
VEDMNEKVTFEQISKSIRCFLFENYLFGYDEKGFSNDSSFLELGVLDSTGILELILFVENQFNIEIKDSEILPENLDSISFVSRLVYKKINFKWEVEI